MMQRVLVLSFLFLTLLVVGRDITPLVYAQATPEQIKSQMAERSNQIKDLEAEIASFQKQLNTLAGQKQTLQSAIKTLDISRSQLQAQINLTEKKISAANLKLEQLGFEIMDKEEVIELDRKTLAKSIRTMSTAGDVSLIEQLFAADTLSEAWEAADQMSALNQALRTNMSVLAEAKDDLKDQEQEVNATQQELIGLRTTLTTEKKGLDINRQEQQKLLAQTQSKESEYQALIALKQQQRKQFEAELSALEDSLNVAVDSSRIPSAGSGILRWPFSDAFMQTCKGKAGALGNSFCITQYFGTTAFSTQNPQVYNGGGHNAVDFGVPIGTPVQAALAGTVLDTGNTDAIPGCYSFGKWVVVKHANGLATLYAHLSNIQVSPGQAVSTGSVVGYSGMTGYATGPHLHFGVYASQGIQIMTLAAYRGATTPCANAKKPVAPKEAYLNPMSYL
ncbi:peptidoglycan DD-metalloendopeptidase family protein [Patescibacteria group bacterium]|nr:peptidoglycan DD-metalloendopeptidase family protein [Patescibacteria group bacterium]MBU1755100.1 peptidoglycan DD-metalloendopeptidase family protein [Patescibacteria group bacterium]